MKNPPKCGSCNCDASHRDGFRVWEIDGVNYDTCPRFLITGDSAYLLQLFTHYRRGLMPLAGGLFDQPNRYVEAMYLIENEAHDNEG